MLALVGGIIATIIGVVLFIIWWGFFIKILAGIIPILLVLGGALAIYIGIDELKDKMQRDSDN